MVGIRLEQLLGHLAQHLQLFFVLVRSLQLLSLGVMWMGICAGVCCAMMVVIVVILVRSATAVAVAMAMTSTGTCKTKWKDTIDDEDLESVRRKTSFD